MDEMASRQEEKWNLALPLERTTCWKFQFSQCSKKRDTAHSAYSGQGIRGRIARNFPAVALHVGRRNESSSIPIGMNEVG